MRFKDKVVWITGASSGIGEALVYAFHREGARIILSSRSKNELERVWQNCMKNREHLHVLPLDLAALDTLPEKARAAMNLNGLIDILINNGGVSQRACAVDTAFDVDERIMKVNFFGTVALTKAVLPEMLKRRSGHIVVVSSIMGKFGAPLRSAYAASKHALQGYFDSLRAEVHVHNIKVTLVCPGFIRTNVSFNALNGDGAPHGKMDKGQEKGMSADACARKILHAVAKNKEEIYPGGMEVAGVYAKRFFPYLFSKIIRKVKVT